MSLTDAQWARIERLLPDRTPRLGGRWRDHRQVIDAIAFKYRTGTPWMDLPEHFGSWKGTHNRLRMWAADATWEKVFTALLAQADAEGDLAWVVAVDSTTVRAHQHAPGARQKGPLPAGRPIMPSDGPAAGRLPRSTLPPTTAAGRRPSFSCPGQAGDAPAFVQVMTRLRVPRPVGRPRITPDVVPGTRPTRPARSDTICGAVESGRYPAAADQAANRKRLGRLGGHPPAFDREAHKQRKTRALHQQAQQWRGLATRYDCEDVRVLFRVVA
ncbi:IS5 family transposase [Streptomyces sp. 3211]|uniref:IS5 family transposase n=1 Tax=Streptomyces sp. 3211 TaxID=1964449 RepID=UPI000D1B3651|nr:IS5 family transposase [Streptomyces sp. 3211]